MNGESSQQRQNRTLSNKKNLKPSSSNDTCSICQTGFSITYPRKTCKSCKAQVCVTHSRKRYQGRTKRRLCDSCAYPNLDKKIESDWMQDIENLRYELENLQIENKETKHSIQELKKEEERYKLECQQEVQRNQQRVKDLMSELHSEIQTQEITEKKLISTQNSIREVENLIHSTKVEHNTIHCEKSTMVYEVENARAHIKQLMDHVENLHFKALNSIPAPKLAVKICSTCQAKLFGSTDLVRKSFSKPTAPLVAAEPPKGACNSCNVI